MCIVIKTIKSTLSNPFPVLWTNIVSPQLQYEKYLIKEWTECNIDSTLPNYNYSKFSCGPYRPKIVTLIETVVSFNIQLH